MEKEILAEIKHNCVNCNKCYEACIMLQELGSSFTAILENDNLNQGKNKCTLCGLCTSVCPKSLEITTYYALLKQNKLNPLLLNYFRKKHQKRIEKTNV